jgi:hypothetical protein
MKKKVAKLRIPRLEFLTREVTPGINGQTELLINGKKYRIPNHQLIGSGIPKPYWDLATEQWCCTRSRDFGGCGKDAVKPEKNVPYGTWLREVGAEEINE